MTKDLKDMWDYLSGIERTHEAEAVAKIFRECGDIEKNALLIDVGGRDGSFVKEIENHLGKKFRIYISELEKYRKNPADKRYKYLEKDANELSKCELFEKEQAEVLAL